MIIKVVPQMVKRVKDWLAEGKDVRIFTARVGREGLEAIAALRYIQKWCETHLGRRLPVTCKKDLGMIELWDDRCVQVITNTGKRVDELKTPADTFGIWGSQ